MNTKEQNPDLDKLILQSLADGLEQKGISQYFKTKEITPNSISFIEKRIKALKEEHRAYTLFQLALIVKLKGII